MYEVVKNKIINLYAACVVYPIIYRKWLIMCNVYKRKEASQLIQIKRWTYSYKDGH